MTRATRLNMPVRSDDAYNPGAPSYFITPSRLGRWRNAVGKVRAGSSSAKLLCVGDSTTFGLYSGTISTNSYPTRLSQLMNTYYVPAALGIVAPPSTFISGPFSPTDTRWSIGTGWSYSGWGFSSASALFANGANSPGTITYTPGINVDTFDVWYLQNGGLGSLRLSVDGGTVTTQSCVGGLALVKKTISAGAAASSHVLSIGATINSVFVVGIDAYLSTATQVRVGNVGVCSSRTSDWATEPAAGGGGLGAITAWQPDLTVISLGINDALTGTNMTVPTWQGYMQSIITAAQVSGDVIIASVIPSSGATASQPGLEAQYRAAGKALAQANGCGYVDLFGRFGSWATAQGQGLMSDELHPTGAGYYDVAQALFTALKVL